MIDEAGEECDDEDVEAPVDPVEPNEAGGWQEVIPDDDEEPPDEDPALPIGDDMFTGRPVVDDCKSKMSKKSS